MFLDFAICKMDGCWLVTKPNKMKIFLLAIHISMKLLTTFWKRNIRILVISRKKILVNGMLLLIKEFLKK